MSRAPNLRVIRQSGINVPAALDRVRVEGEAETLAAMEQMSEAMTRAVMRRALKAAGEPIQRDAQRLIDPLSGRLRRGIIVSPILSKNQAAADYRQDQAEMYIGPARGKGQAWWGGWLEFGTVKTGAKPFLRPAWEGNKGSTLGLIQTRLAFEVDRAAARAARKAARVAARVAAGG